MRIFYYCFIDVSNPSVNAHVAEVIGNLSGMGHDVLLLVPKMGESRLNEDMDICHVPIIKFPVLKWITYDILSFFYLLILSSKNRPDVIYFRETESLAPLLASKMIHCPLVIEVNGWILDELKMVGYPEWKLRFFAFCQKHNFRGSTKIIAVSSGIKELIQKQYGIEDSKVVVISNGTDAHTFRPLDMIMCKRKLGLPVNQDYVGFIGSCYPHHGLEHLIDCAPLVLEEFPTVRFMIAGDGAKRQEWQTKVHQMGLTEHFDFPGMIPLEKAPYYINSFAICVGPWKKRFASKTGFLGSPLKLFDYMACGRPVVVSRIKGVTEIVDGYRTGLTVDVENLKEFAETLIRLLKDERLRDTMGKNGRNVVEREFTWEVTARKIVGLLQELNNDVEPHR